MPFTTKVVHGLTSNIGAIERDLDEKLNAELNKLAHLGFVRVSEAKQPFRRLRTRRYYQTPLTKKKSHSASFAETIDKIRAERHGIRPYELLYLIGKLQLPVAQVFQFLNIPKTTALQKIKTGKPFVGTEAHGAVRLLKLLRKAKSITSDSLHPDAKDFDYGKWLGEWLESPQPALGGIKPSELLDTEVGGQRVYQVLSALESGSYQ